MTHSLKVNQRPDLRAISCDAVLQRKPMSQPQDNALLPSRRELTNANRCTFPVTSVSSGCAHWNEVFRRTPRQLAFWDHVKLGHSPNLISLWVDWGFRRTWRLFICERRHIYANKQKHCSGSQWANNSVAMHMICRPYRVRCNMCGKEMHIY